MIEVVQGLTIGITSGFAAGLTGVSPGGGLIIYSDLLLAVEQHVAQGISLFAQIPPTSLSGIKRYRAKGSRVPLRWLGYISAGFLTGGVGGAMTAGYAPAKLLQWALVTYLVALAALLILRRKHQPVDEEAAIAEPSIAGLSLLLIGMFAGFCSGFLGIGGGLAITVGLSAGLKIPQRRAQAVSLAASLVPTTLPAAWVYWRQGFSVSWFILGGIVLGLWFGTDLGARIANRVSRRTLHNLLVGYVFAMASYMAVRALT